MGKRIHEKESALSTGNCNGTHHTHPGRVWGILNGMKYHQWHHVKRRLTHRKYCGRLDARSPDDSGTNSISEHYKPYTALSNDEEQLLNSSPPAKHSMKSRIRSIINEDMYKRKGRHKRSSTCPEKSHRTPVDSVHNLEVDPATELLLSVDSPEPILETFQNHLAAGTLDELSPVFSENPANHDKCVDCGTMFSSDMVEQNKIHKHLGSSNQGGPEEKLMNAKILTTDASPHLFKDFLDALDVINTNKDYLLEYIEDPGSPLPFHSQNQHSFNGTLRRSKSLSFPVLSPSSSGNQDSDPGQLINQMVEELLNAEENKLQVKSNMQNTSVNEFSEDVHRLSTPSCSSHQSAEKDHSSSSISSQVQSNMKTRHFRDLKKKMKHIIEEGRSEKNRITMDAILDKIPRGRKLTKNVKKFMHDQSKDPTNGEDEDSATSGFGSRLSSNSFNKHRPSPMRTSSLKDSAGRYSRLYETCFNCEAKYPKVENENLRLKSEERNSLLKTAKSVKRVLSMPNIKSYFQQNEAPSTLLSPQNSIKKYGDRTISTKFIDQQQLRFDHIDDLKSQKFQPTLADNTNQENSMNADQKQILVRSASKSGIDFCYDTKSDKSIGIEGLDDLRYSDQDIGGEKESNTTPAEANSIFSSDTSFLDFTFDVDNLLEERSDSELTPGSADGLDNMGEQQEAKEDHREMVENFQKDRILRKHFNYEIPYIEVDANKQAAFNYVRKVLELSGFTGHQSLGIWYSDDQPVNPSVYEELEGCMLLDPDCSGNSGEDGEYNHLLLFDIINEGLLEIFGRSYSYYPRPLSTLCHIHPLPVGENVLCKVWKLISCYLNSTTSELYQPLDYYVSKDLAKYDGWMNLQFDSECVGLELDDLIIDDLLEEIISTQPKFC